MVCWLGGKTTLHHLSSNRPRPQTPGTICENQTPSTGHMQLANGFAIVPRDRQPCSVGLAPLIWGIIEAMMRRHSRNESFNVRACGACLSPRYGLRIPPCLARPHTVQLSHYYPTQHQATLAPISPNSNSPPPCTLPTALDPTWRNSARSTTPPSSLFLPPRVNCRFTHIACYHPQLHVPGPQT